MKNFYTKQPDSRECGRENFWRERILREREREKDKQNEKKVEQKKLVTIRLKTSYLCLFRFF